VKVVVDEELLRHPSLLSKAAARATLALAVRAKGGWWHLNFVVGSRASIVARTATRRMVRP
jgi:hypothetical protein